MKESPGVSIILHAYNNLEYTKVCVDSIMKHTLNTNYELITINNGSTDNTGVFFNSLPNSKKINFTKKCGVAKAFNEGIKIADGQFTVLISNDVILTPNCIENLIECANSDCKIGMVAPVCNYSSNSQQVNLSYDNILELYATAEKYNKSNPLMWEEKLKLLNYLTLFKTDILKNIGGLEEIYNSDDIYDDDISFRIRRKGYKLILATDTFVHLFKLSTSQNSEKINLYEKNNKIFLTKFGVDVLKDTSVDTEITNLVDYKKSKCIKLLGIGSQCGGTLLEIKNKFKNNASDVELYALTNNEKYLKDLQSICLKAVCDNEENISKTFSNIKFDYIIINSDFYNIKKPKAFLKNLKIILKDDGQLIFSVPNKLYYKNLKNLINSDSLFTQYINVNKIVELLKKIGFQKLQLFSLEVTPDTEDLAEIENLKAFFNLNENDLLCTKRFIMTTKGIKSVNRVLLYTGYDSYQDDSIFDDWQFYNSLGVDTGKNLFAVVRDEFKKHGYEMTTINDLNDIDDANFVIFNDVPKNYQNHFYTQIYNNLYKGQIYFEEFLKRKKQGKTKAKLIARLDEPPFVMPENYDKKTLQNFDLIFTYYDNLVDNKKYFKYYIPQPENVKNPYTTNYYHKKLCTFIGSYKHSQTPHELYTERENAISYFEKYYRKDFDFYGKGWAFENHPSYKGTIINKLEILSKYKFCICYENGIIDDWISEKIFECFYAGCVPIYLGAPNIQNYIPTETFIDKRNFKDYNNLYHYLNRMDREEYNEYLKNIKLFLNSDDYKKFTRESFAKRFVNIILTNLEGE